MAFRLVENTDMAYLVGVYIGDGHVSRGRGSSYMFELSSVDRDFLEHVLGIVGKYVAGCNPSIRLQRGGGSCSMYGEEYAVKDLWRLRVCNTDFAKWLVRVTDRKSRIPKFCKASTSRIIAFLEGVVDCEGWVSKVKDERYRAGYKYEMGVQMKDCRLVREIKEMFAMVGIRTGKMWTNGGRSSELCGFLIRIGDFARRMRLHVRRKQELVEEYMAAMGVKYAPVEDVLVNTLDVFY